ncbi:hypothetical protein [Heyndrickxia ginsengihumi]|uniref:hypothetical protein n=1 Tax=Heyndrickxia ginsengihumi TaxID=363870 RepID=UPI003D19963C
MKVRKNFRFNEETANKLKNFCEQTNKTEIEVVESALNQFIDHNGEVKDALTLKLEAICEQTVEKVIKEKVTPDLSKIRAAANNADFYSQVAIELMNHQFKNLDRESVITTDIQLTPAVNKAILTVKDRIKTLRIKKLNREVKNKI